MKYHDVLGASLVALVVGLAVPSVSGSLSGPGASSGSSSGGGSGASATFMQNTPSVIKIHPTTNWSRYTASCDPAGDEALLSCGSLGKYQLMPAPTIPGCTRIASGSAALDPYPRFVQGGSGPFPGNWEIAADQAIAALSAPNSALTSGGASEVGVEMDSANFGEGDWIAVVDFDDEHGWSTSYLTALVAGPWLDTELIPLDAGPSDPLGEEVNDFHVLRALCSIVDRVESGQDVAPRSVNMSFGRLKAAGEPWFGSQCRSGKFGCQIAQAIGELKGFGVDLFAAAGNHGELLFPGGLPDVLTTGVLDLHSMRGESGPAGVWENPPGVEALAPGGHLCLDETYAAPAGTSYSSAMLAGWFGSIPGGLPPHQEGEIWTPVWNDTLQCFALSDGTAQIGACNAGATSVFMSLDGSVPNPCWSAGLSQPIEIFAPGSGPTPPNVPSFDYWAERIHPTPSGDPCVPCVGLSRIEIPLVPVLEINVGHSRGLDPDVYISSVYLKTVTGFEHVPLSQNELEALRAGTMDQLNLSGYAMPGPGGPQPSLWFELSDEPNPDCAGNSECFWTASDILILQSP